MTDLEIAKDIKLQHISKIAEKLNLDPDDIEMYGKYKAKLPLAIINEEKVKVMWKENDGEDGVYLR